MPSRASSLPGGPPPAPTSRPQPSPCPADRNAFIDHVRIVLTCLVVLHHAASVYGGSGGWYWREQPDGSSMLLVAFNAINQSFFMGFFFLLAGYYTPRSLDRKGPARFLKERLTRLGIPLFLYAFALSPVTMAVAETGNGSSFWDALGHAVRGGHFEPGPLWFCEALILFALGYLAWRALLKPTVGPQPASLPRFGVMAAWALGLGLASFAVRLALPVGQSVAWLQLGYFPCYIFLFAAGCAAARGRLLERIGRTEAMPWMIVSALAIATLPIALATRLQAGPFTGGWSLNALYYALWDPLAAWGILLGALWLFRARANRPIPLTNWLGRRAFGAFIIHPLVLVGLSVGLADWAVAPLPKFALVGAAACIGSFLAASLLLRIPGARRVL